MSAQDNSDEYIRHMAAIVEFSDDAIVSNSLAGIVKTWNGGAERMFGFTAAEAVGKHISMIIPLDYLEEEKQIVKRIIGNETIDHFETVRIKKNGDRFFVSLTISPLKNGEGEIIGISKILRDVSARKTAEADQLRTGKQLSSQKTEIELRAAELLVANKELKFQNLEKANRAAELVIANEELVFQNREKEKRAAELNLANIELVFQNAEKEKRAGELVLANEELAFQNEEKSKRASELVIANDELAFQNAEKERRASELVLANKELAFQNEEKSKRAAELIIANVELAFQNIEKEKRAAELVLVNKELAAKEVMLKKHNKELEQFAYVASHDLQEPLRTVSNYMQVFEEDYMPLLDKKAIGYLGSVNRATERMSALIKSLLEFSRLGRNSELKTVDCKELINEVMADLHTLIEGSNAVVTVGAMPVLTLYEVEMGQLFQNLIINAIKFHRNGVQPEISIQCTLTQDVYKFSVADNGIGIDHSHFDRIFQIFQRLPNRNKVRGNGIGLANCMKIVMLHGGELWVESKPGEGATFVFTLKNLNQE